MKARPIPTDRASNFKVLEAAYLKDVAEKRQRSRRKRGLLLLRECKAGTLVRLPDSDETVKVLAKGLGSVTVERYTQAELGGKLVKLGSHVTWSPATEVHLAKPTAVAD